MSQRFCQQFGTEHANYCQKVKMTDQIEMHSFLSSFLLIGLHSSFAIPKD